jgi:hypothetical protein
MNIDLADAMRAAMNLTRAQRLVEATRVIQRALAGREPIPSASPSEAAIGLAIETHVIDLTAEVIEPEMMASAGLEADKRSDQPQPPSMAAWNAGRLGKALAKLRHAELPRFNLGRLTLRGPRKALEIPDGAQFLSRSFSCAAGGRNYKLYVPSRPQKGRRALLVMLHGGTQDADDFATGTRMNALAEEHGFIVAYPNQSKAANVSLCWNWFSPENQMRGRGEPAIIAGITSEIIADTVARKKSYMKDAQQKWRFLTNLDCSSIKTEGQLCSMVQTRSSISEAQAKRDVDAWMQGKQF